MKKFFFSGVAFMASVTLFAQVDSTTQAPATDSSSQAAITADTTTAPVASADTASITDEDLKKYAVVMDSVEAMKQNLLSEISTKIKSNGKIKISRYNELSKAINDQAKLTELKATPQEIAFVKEVGVMKTEGAAKISDTVEILAKDFVGAEKYNNIKNSLTTNTELKARYDEIFSEVQSQGSASAKTSN
jgi:hypothetical protein